MKAPGIHILFIMTLGIISAPAKGQYAGATAKLDSTTMLIGSQSRLELDVTVPAGSLVNWPVFGDTLTGHVEILRKSGLDTLSIKPIKPPLKAPVTLAEILTWVGLALVVAAIAFGVYYFLLKKKKKEPLIKLRLKPSIPPDEAALEALEALKLKKLWQSGKVKEYYSEMTDIVREYIELRFLIRALEMTTDEIRMAMHQSGIDGGAKVKLLQTLTLADLVKFAKEQPLPM
jgi:hypothetical protein